MYRNGYRGVDAADLIYHIVGAFLFSCAWDRNASLMGEASSWESEQEISWTADTAAAGRVAAPNRQAIRADAKNRFVFCFKGIFLSY